MELALKETFIEMDTMMRTKEGQRRLIEIKLGTDNQSDIEFYNEEKNYCRVYSKCSSYP